MYNFLKKSLVAATVVGALSSTSVIADERFNVGRTAAEHEIAGWDIDIRPDGKGLPVGEGSVMAGEPLYEAKCAACHGLFGEGEGRWPALVGGKDTLSDERPNKTVGSYWPYASTLYDYIYRSMPFHAPRSLNKDETYAITAYVLYMNEIIDDEEFVLSNENLADIEMPNEDGFFVDPRPDVKNERCMKDCKDPTTINIVNTIGGVTPATVVEINDGNGDALEEAHEGSRIAGLSAKEEGFKGTPKTPELSDDAKAGKAVYDKACFACHAGGIVGAPKAGLKASWETRAKQGMDVLIQHAIEGYHGKAGYMPPKGGRTDLSDKEVGDAVKYMVEISQ